MTLLLHLLTWFHSRISFVCFSFHALDLFHSCLLWTVPGETALLLQVKRDPAPHLASQLSDRRRDGEPAPLQVTQLACSLPFLSNTALLALSALDTEL